MKQLFTTLGNRELESIQTMLTHEHVFVDLRTPDTSGFAQAEAEAVIRLMAPELQAAAKAGISVVVECTPVGVGRRTDLLKAVSESALFPLVVPTGVYREPWIPAWVQDASEEALTDWMTRELTEGIEDTGIRAGWIKLSAGDNGMTDCERKVLRAAAKSGAKTGAVIGSHTVKGAVVREQLDIIEGAGYTPERFIWIHAHQEDDFPLNLEMADRGAWIEYDAIGSGPDEFFIERIQRMLDAGYPNQILLSQDRGWYDPAQPGGGTPQPFTYIIHEFLPKLAASGIDGAVVSRLMRENPFNAFARQGQELESP
jgi:phosphotriesterase-related protein